MKAFKDAEGRVRMFRPDLNMARFNASVRVVTFSFLCPLLEKYGTFIARCNALIEKVSSCSVPDCVFRLSTAMR
eukprot:SAG31_NODE_2395_length_5790_cov_73.555614_2_plen_74_part_00